MTAAVEDDQTDAAEPTPRQKHLAEWLEAMAAADKMLCQVIADELAEDLPAFEQAQEKAAKALEAAYAVLQDPERALAALDAEIAGAEAELGTWQSRLEQGDVTARVEARRWVAEWENELAALRPKREFAESQLLPFRDEWNKARVKLEQATAKLEGRRLNATPAFAYFGAGQKTAGYGFRFGLALEPALRDRDHYEHGAAVEHMLYLCAVSGFRTEDHADRLPSDAEQARRFWDSVYEGYQHPESAPTGVQVIGAIHDEMNVSAENKRLEAAPARVDDRRGAHPQPAPPRPRNEVVPPSRQYQSLRDLGLR